MFTFEFRALSDSCLIASIFLVMSSWLSGELNSALKSESLKSKSLTEVKMLKSGDIDKSKVMLH